MPAQEIQSNPCWQFWLQVAYAASYNRYVCICQECPDQYMQSPCYCTAESKHHSASGHWPSNSNGSSLPNARNICFLLQFSFSVQNSQCCTSLRSVRRTALHVHKKPLLRASPKSCVTKKRVTWYFLWSVIPKPSLFFVFHCFLHNTKSGRVVKTRHVLPFFKFIITLILCIIVKEAQRNPGNKATICIHPVYLWSSGKVVTVYQVAHTQQLLWCLQCQQPMKVYLLY